MNVRLKKSFNSLPTREQELLTQLMADECKRRMDEEEVNLFLQYMKSACIVLHDYKGFTVEELMIFIGSFTNIRRKFRKLTSIAELEASLDKEMERIFDGKFPTDFVERLQRGE